MKQKLVIEHHEQRHVLVLEDDYDELRELLVRCKKQLSAAYERISASDPYRTDVLLDGLVCAVYDIDAWEETQP